MDLKPCPDPWCGKSSPGIYRGGFRNLRVRVQCSSCGAHAQESEFESVAVEAWNTRPREDALTEEVEALRAALTFGVKLYGMDGPAYWPVDDRIRFDELARAALKGKDHE